MSSSIPLFKISGTSCKTSSVTRSTSLTWSTINPAYSFKPDARCTLTINTRFCSQTGAFSRPKRLRRLIKGSNRPLNSISPITCASVFGMLAMLFGTRTISSTSIKSKAYSCSSTKKLTSWLLVSSSSSSSPFIKSELP